VTSEKIQANPFPAPTSCFRHSSQSHPTSAFDARLVLDVSWLAKEHKSKGKKKKKSSDESSSSQGATRKKAESTSWDVDQDDNLLTELLKLKNTGKMPENSFKKQHFAAVADSLNDNYPDQKVPKTEKSTQARWQKVRSPSSFLLFITENTIYYS